MNNNDDEILKAVQEQKVKNIVNDIKTRTGDKFI